MALIFHFYYGYGDSFNYFTGATEIWSAFKDKPSYAVELIFKPLSQCSAKALTYAVHMDYANWGDATTYMFKISGFIGLFCFGSYLPIALIFSAFSFYGLWKIFTVFYKEFPQYHKLIAVGTLLAPSALFWSTNILKTLCAFLLLGFYLMPFILYLKKPTS
ncbi:MAG: hypothetical protein IPP48_05630 [Chitinophagaceae bacterium]|nr:hypothetical protein [Chitinophagaceae bacterium]